MDFEESPKFKQIKDEFQSGLMPLLMKFYDEVRFFPTKIEIGKRVEDDTFMVKICIDPKDRVKLMWL